MRRVTLDEADRILIDTVERAIEVGLGHTFTTTGGQTVKVVEINERWVEIEVLTAQLGQETITLPRNARRIAWGVAKMRAIERAEV